jgi:phosphatidylserine/phosphatidylglycerophosphate/cardiolipin synthase-like enzyme
MSAFRRALLAGVCLALSACANLSSVQRARAGDIAERARDTRVTCAQDCRIYSPLLALGDAANAASTATQPRHSLMLLDSGQDALLARLHLIRAARRSIDLQTFHFEHDDVGQLVLEALQDAARRGVHVRLLMDPLSGLDDPALQAGLAGFHRNFEIRLYNPLFRLSRVAPLQLAGAILFRFRDLNQRMHSKMMVIDGQVGLVGGRNIEDDYFDWDSQYDYRDRDLLVAGPATRAMTANFDAFWNHPRAVPPSQLDDVASVLLDRNGVPPPRQEPLSERAKAMSALASDGAAVFARLSAYLYQVGKVDFYGDLPAKHDNTTVPVSEASRALLEVLEGTRRELLLQTPYLVMSRPARQLFRRLHRRGDPPNVLVSTNSLAATDAFPVYAMSHKYKRLYLRELGFEIHEYKPFPLDAPIDLAATGALGGHPTPPEALEFAGTLGSRHGPVPLKSAGVRIGLHAKSMVVDGEIAIVGSHNFDPRSTDYNTENLVVVHDAPFAAALAASIRRDMAPENAWTIAPRPKLPVLAQLNYNLGKLSEKLPIFDVWPLPYATSFEIKPGCAPLPPSDPGFAACYTPVGDFPEVNLSLKGIYTRILTVFGAGLVPIL